MFSPSYRCLKLWLLLKDLRVIMHQKSWKKRCWSINLVSANWYVHNAMTPNVVFLTNHLLTMFCHPIGSYGSIRWDAIRRRSTNVWYRLHCFPSVGYVWNRSQFALHRRRSYPLSEMLFLCKEKARVDDVIPSQECYHIHAFDLHMLFLQYPRILPDWHHPLMISPPFPPTRMIQHSSPFLTI